MGKLSVRVSGSEESIPVGAGGWQEGVSRAGSSDGPVFDTEARHFGEVAAVARKEGGVVDEDDSGDLQSHCPDASFHGKEPL